MNGVFFFLSGMIIAQKTISNNIIDRMVAKYFKFVPMVIGGGMTAYLVMQFGLTYHIRLMEYSHAANYVQWANEFEPSLLGERGVLKDIFIMTFIDSSKYDSPLWFLAVLFWGTLIEESIEKSINDNKVRVLIYVMLYMVVTDMETVDWRVPYLGYIFAGALIGHLDIVSFQKFKVSKWLSFLLFIVGIYITAPSDFVGFYLPLRYLSTLGMHLKVIGIILLVVSVSINTDLQKAFNTRISQWLNKYSFGIYVFHWSFVISVSCAVTYMLIVTYNLDYMISGFVGIVSGLMATLLCSVIYTEEIYKPLNKLFSAVINIIRIKLRKFCDGR